MSAAQPKSGFSMDELVALTKRRGFIFPGSEIYGGLANSWDYGPLGIEMRRNIKELWWKRFVRDREDVVGLESGIIMNPRVWEASGHLAGFSDQLVECKNCHERYRVDHIDLKKACAKCGKKGTFTEPKQFNLMFKTFIGPSEEKANVAYMRPETAQGMFVDFKQILETTRVKLPFGVAQIGKVFRNEITPGNFIFRTREFAQMEIEYFFAPPKSDKEWQTTFEHWRKEMASWIDFIGIDPAKVHEVEIQAEDRAHYSKRTIDFEFEYPFGQDELYGLAYRGDFDLKNHMEKSRQDLRYFDAETKQKFLPHCVEPTWGVDRTLLAILCSAYKKDGDRVYLSLKPAVAPYKAAIFPLLRNKPELVKKARDVFESLRKVAHITWDDRGNIGKRYYYQDEIGTPAGITIDFDTLKDDTVTWRDRDTAKQTRVPIKQLAEKLRVQVE